jgi:hypothetical protein
MRSLLHGRELGILAIGRMTPTFPSTVIVVPSDSDSF